KHVDMGSLPFRVWQVFDYMVSAASASSFLCAAGVLGHYLGDAGQPLHTSMHSDGLDGASTGVHSTYEEVMIDRYAPELAAALDTLGKSDLSLQARDESSIQSGFEAVLAAIELMARAQQYLPPVDLCNTYERLGGGQSHAVVEGLWNAFGKPTAKCIADGARTLGQLWQAAYHLNGHNKSFAGEIAREVLQKLYEDKTFLPSVHLMHLNEKDYKPR
ncbi:MAG: S1/P1 Nuclease, partial [Bryobacteraceae bacterium]